jgi:hypothetical protein
MELTTQRGQQHPQATSQMRSSDHGEWENLEEDEDNPVCQPLFVIVKRFRFNCLRFVRLGDRRGRKKKTLMEAMTGNTKPTRSLKSQLKREGEKCDIIHDEI